MYSAELRALVLECLLREPEQRPTSTDLQRRTRAGLDGCAEAKKPLDNPRWHGLPRRPPGIIPPPEWALVDNDCISLMIKIWETPQARPWHVFIDEIPRVVKVEYLKNLIHEKQFGNAATEMFLTSVCKVDEEHMRLRYRGRDLGETETLQGLGMRDMDVVLCFPTPILRDGDRAEVEGNRWAEVEKREDAFDREFGTRWGKLDARDAKRLKQM